MKLGARACGVVIATVLVWACSSSDATTGSSSPAAVATAPAPATDAGDSADAAEEETVFVPAPQSPTCVSFTYSDWSACRYDSEQVRSVVSALPAGCVLGGPTLKQPCTFVAPTDGPSLYQAYCSGCHGDSKKGRTADQIQNAINSNAGGMSVLSSLTPEQIALIAAAK